jgi:O-antigen/teichoic acid export membrane protein
VSAAEPVAVSMETRPEEAHGLAAAPRGSVATRRLRTWSAILAAYFGSQTLTQLLGIAAGIVFVRYMPLEQFALYTLGSSVITFFAFTTDLGSTGSLVHFYRRALKQGEDFGGYVAAVMSLRRVAFLVGAVVVAVVFPLMAASRGFTSFDVGIATVAILAAVAAQIGASLRLIALRLHDRYGQSYRAEMAGAGLRLVLALAMVAAAALQAWLALVVAALGSALTTWTAKAGAHFRITGEPAVIKERRAAVVRYLLPTLPSALYFAVQGPLLVWLAAYFGASQTIAEVGALSRLGLIVGIFGGLSSVVFLPRLAGIQDERLWRTRVAQFLGAQLTIGGALVLVSFAAPTLLLSILGEQYTGLRSELVLIVAGAALRLVDGYLVGVNLSRAYTRWQPVAVLSLALFQAGLVALLPLAETANVLTFNLLSAVFAAGGQMTILLASSRQSRHG